MWWRPQGELLPALPLVCCVTLGEWVRRSLPQFPSLPSEWGSEQQPVVSCLSLSTRGGWDTSGSLVTHAFRGRGPRSPCWAVGSGPGQVPAKGRLGAALPPARRESPGGQPCLSDTRPPRVHRGDNAVPVSRGLREALARWPLRMLGTGSWHPLSAPLGLAVIIMKRRRRPCDWHPARGRAQPPGSRQPAPQPPHRPPPRGRRAEN